ncbi:sel1 domain protein repeat-containing protein [Stylonychia lemnae]|uniref:Sel1 domain protein repeat-containing protein n=1 Tax=Stylonychia lemnae TaxID=5949 RepID=A0A078AL14_STYLE|nr:sel1 domain protein repeat-containing protein [Stylonychia lemnae]|eukprot:CDW82127.1 sel1 domain protein repeat-containing protein [Stylonychia lemnae]
MANQKQTQPLLQKLQAVIQALKRCGQQNPDIDQSPPYIRILEEVKDNFKDVGYYTEDFNKRNAIAKKQVNIYLIRKIRTKGSSIRSKLTILQNSIANYARLIESLSIVRNQQNNQYEEASEENKDGNIQPRQVQYYNDGSQQQHEKKLQNKIDEFEVKLQMFLKQQSMQDESDYQQKEYAQKLSLIEKGDIKSSRRIQHNNSSQERGPNDKDNLNKNKQNYNNGKLSDLNVNKAFSDEPRSPLRFNKGQEYCLEAHCLLYGHGIEPNTEVAMVWYERSANLGEPRAIDSLGKLYEDGVGTRIDLNKAVQHFQRAAELGDPSSQYKLAKYYQRGGIFHLNEGKPDGQKSFELLQSAAQENQKEALRELGFIYEKGGLIEGQNPGKFILLVDIDIKKALDYYQKSAKYGDELAMNYLGSYYFNHSQDYDKAVQFFRQASESGKCERALNNLAICFEQGIGDAVQDYYQALKLYEQSAILGYDQALINQAFLYYKVALSGHNLGDMDSSELYFQCAQCLRKALFKDENNCDAIFLLAKLYEEGLSIDQNPQLAYKYYEKAANLGFPKAYTKLGHLYYSGMIQADNQDLVTPFYMTKAHINKLKSMEYYQKASDLGDTDASNCLGLIYESGLDTCLQADIEIAERNYYLALKQNKQNLDAMFNLGLLLFNGNHNDPSKSKLGITYIQQAADQGDLRAKEFQMISQMQTVTQNFVQNLIRLNPQINQNDSILNDEEINLRIN